ncbi:methylated-DNA--[protein]-cysteine S-methyltransferase [Pseudoroseomonas globiformis]|uniref:Methylated-DNA--protein-cysteine methyltransferase n=1 Tax=Teichococcus globiformis TaxID=2307229 RepID=A0ABV7G1C3_9PROT
MTLILERFASPIGEVLLVARDARLAALEFGDDWGDASPRPANRLARLLAARFGSGTAPMEGRTGFAAPLAAYFKGNIAALDALPLDPGGTSFQRRCWNALRAIRPGETRSYGAVAAAIGRPGAARAVGLANALNPISIAIPCHRLVGGNGALTGYGGGLARKRWLLDHERRSRPGGPGA